MANRLPEKQALVAWNEDRTDSASGFLWLGKNDMPEVAQHWSNHLRWTRKNSFQNTI